MEALQILGFGNIRVCSRSSGSLESLQGVSDITTKAVDYRELDWYARPDELAIIATPINSLCDAAKSLCDLGFRKIFIEKPISLYSVEMQKVVNIFQNKGIQGICGYNRTAYPAFHELRFKVHEDGGISSCNYSITEIVREDWQSRFSTEELARWGIANSIHPIAMAHGLIGLPKIWKGFRSGSMEWHPTGIVFVGSGISDMNIPFTYHGDWGSKGRWSVEAHTEIASYLMKPLEKLYRKESPNGEWNEIPVSIFEPDVKDGIMEQVAALLDPYISDLVPLFSLEESTSLTRYAESVFGYGSN